MPSRTSVASTAGTLELVRSLGVEVLSSADALASVVAAWDAADLASHQRAAPALERGQGRPVCGNQAAAWPWVRPGPSSRLSSTWPHAPARRRPRVRPCRHRGGRPARGRSALRAGAGGGAADPARATWCWSTCGRTKRADQTAASARTPTLPGWLPRPTARRPSTCRCGRRSRGARRGGALLSSSASGPARRSRVARSIAWRAAVIDAAGYGAAFTHRTGHSIGWLGAHGDGVNIDDFETHDTRLLRPGGGVFDRAGDLPADASACAPRSTWRSPRAGQVKVTTPPQTELVRLV